MKVHENGEHSSFTNVDLVAIQSLDPQAVDTIWHFPPKSSEGWKKDNNKFMQNKFDHNPPPPDHFSFCWTKQYNTWDVTFET